MLYTLALIFLSLLRMSIPLLRTLALLLVSLLLLHYPPHLMMPPAQEEVLGLGTEALQPRLLLRAAAPRCRRRRRPHRDMMEVYI